MSRAPASRVYDDFTDSEKPVLIQVSACFRLDHQDQRSVKVWRWAEKSLSTAIVERPEKGLYLWGGGSRKPFYGLFADSLPEDSHSITLSSLYE